jgi:hypothetical protein
MSCEQDLEAASKRIADTGFTAQEMANAARSIGQLTVSSETLALEMQRIAKSFKEQGLSSDVD